MKKLVLSLFILLAVSVVSFAQERTITGTVTSSEDGLPIPGVSVKVKEIAGSGVTTGSDGKFSIKVTAAGKTLVVSSIAFSTKEVAITGTSVSITLDPDTKGLNEVVVQGVYGTKSTQRTSTSNLQTISGDKLNTVRSTNINNALAGKVAGVQVRSQSAAALGRNTEVRLRGGNGFGTGNGVLYVVDGTVLPNADDINLDDIEDISVMQGPAASALLGAQGSNGAIIITTKKGRSGPGKGITVNLGATFEDAYVLPNYQNSYAGGNSANLMKYTWKATDPLEWKALDGKYYHDYSDDTSWGPRMVGQEYIPWYAWYGGTKYSYKTTTLDPQPNNARDYYNTGVNLNNTISYGTSNEKSNFKMTYGNQYVSGLIPESDLLKNTFQLVGNYDISKHFSVGANINYVKQVLNGNIEDGYSNLGTGAFNQWFHRNLDMGIMKELKDLTVPGAAPGRDILASWNHFNPTAYDPANTFGFYGNHYWFNPYSYQDYNTNENQRDRLYGNVSLTYKVNNDLKFTATYRKQQNTTFSEGKTYDILQRSGQSIGAFNGYSTANTYSNIENYEGVGNYVKKIKDFSLALTAGVDIRRQRSNSNSANTNNGLSIPDLFTVNNSVNPPSIGNGRSKEGWNALFSHATVGYKNYIFLDATVRNDWFSTLPEDNNSVLSKSFGASFVFSDLLPANIKGSWLSEGKLRASWGEVPEQLAAYQYPGLAYGVNAQKLFGNLLMQYPDGIVDPTISGAVKIQKEIGVDFKFLNRRLTVSGTLWDKTESGLPRNVAINAYSGLSSVLTNVGKIKMKGLEVQVGGDPIRSTNFSWNISATYANLLDNEIVEISDKYGINTITAASITFGLPGMVHHKGQQWGQLYGSGMKVNADGVPILDASGLYQTQAGVYYGSVNPKHTGGIQNNFTIFNMFDVSANIDWQIGGKFSSLSNMWGSYSGLTARTATVNDKGMSIRDAVADGGGVRVDGVSEAGQPVTFYVPAQTYFSNFYSRSIWTPYVYDLTFVKLREVSIGYRIPVKKLGLDKFVQSASFSLIARNPVLIYAKTKDFDPSEVSGSAGETAQLPGTRGLGFNLRIGF